MNEKRRAREVPALPVGPTAALLSALLVGVAVALSYRFLDRPVALWAQGLPHGATHACRLLTQVGNSAWSLLPALLGFLWFRRTRRGLARACALVFLSVAATGLVTTLMKIALGRCRPMEFIRHGEYGFAFWSLGYKNVSFPSGHSGTVGALFATLWFLYPRGRPCWLLLALATSATRVLLSEHYVSDVLAGTYLGVLTAAWLYGVFVRKGWDPGPSPEVSACGMRAEGARISPSTPDGARP